MKGQDDRPIVFGEVLFDRFEDGHAVLGGAPFNVAWHLQGFGSKPLFVSRVSNDANGNEVLDTMRAWGLDTQAVQIDNEFPTGAVEVTLKQGIPTFDILPDRAYDFIEIEPLRPLLANPSYSLLYHGTLIARSSCSRATLAALVTELDVPVFVDINLRSPWWSHDLVDQSLGRARWAKLNDEELALIFRTRKLSAQEIPVHARELCQRLGLELVIVTLGAEGALLVTRQQELSGAPVRVDDLVDTVGAGDAFSSVAILGLTLGWPPQETLQRALGFAADVCRIRGATTTDVHLYQARRQEWGL